MEEHVTHIDGVKIRYLAAGSGPALLLLHGVGDSALDWRWAIPGLAHQFRVYAPDLPGYSGGSGNGIVHTPASYSKMMILFIRQLGISSFAIVGNSLGGQVAIRMALENPKEVWALVLVDSAGLGKMINPLLITATTPTGDFAMMASATWLGGWLRSGFRSFLLFANPLQAPREWLQEQQRLAGIPSFRSAVLSILRKTTDFWGQREVLTDELPKLEIPVFILWGNHDQMVPLAHGRNALRMLKHGKMEIFPDCGHVPHIENPVRFADTIGNFLSRIA